MEIGEVLVIGGAILIFGDLIQLINSRKGGGKTGFPMAPLACILLIGSYLNILLAFVTNSFRYMEVYSYSSSGLSMLGKVYASWASSAGSWLFLTALFASGYLVIRYRMKGGHAHAYEFMDVMLIFFIFIVLVGSPFKVYTEAPMEGLGLNPLLQTPWMLIHPPIVFMGYVLAFYGFAFTFDSFRGGNVSSRSPMRILCQLAWLFLTIGLLLGGVWAYEVLGWGGYWSWDPVETASLIPWLIITAFFHLSTIISKRESSSRELMVMLTSSLVILATAITRGGLTVSVHAFGESPIGFVLLTLMATQVGYFLYQQRKTGAPLFDLNVETTSVYSISVSLSFLSVVMIALVSLWGLLFPIAASAFSGGATGMDPSFFNKWNYPFVLVFLASLIGCHLHSKLSVNRFAAICVGLILLGLVGAVLGFPTHNMLANLGIPVAVFAFGAVVYGTLESAIARGGFLRLGRGFIHLGVVFVIIGILFSSTSVKDLGDLSIEPGSSKYVGGLGIEVGEFTLIEPFGNVYDARADVCCSPEAGGLKIPVTVTSGARSLSGDLEIYFYTLHGVVSKPLILRTLDREYYLVLQQSQEVYNSLIHNMLGMPMIPQEFIISVNIHPLMNLIWLGAALMCLGIILTLFQSMKS